MSKYWKLGLGMALMWIMSGCSFAGDGDPLAGTAWNLILLGNAQVMEGYVPSLAFEEGTAGGSTGCNEYSSAYTVKGDKLTLEGVMMTERACMDQRAMGQEGDYARLLQGVTNFRINAEGQLELLDAEDEVLLTYQPAP